MTQLYLALAQATAPARQGDLLSMFMPFLLMIGIFYFLLIRPQQKQLKKHREMLASLQKGDAVITSGGLHGKIAEVQDKVLVVEIADKVKVKIERQAITGVSRGGVETRVETPEAK